MTTTRRIGVVAATGIGVGSMLGAGVFSGMWASVLAVGPWFFGAVLVAGLVALVNALSITQLASRHPVAGGAYSYGRAELGPGFGLAAGVSFVVGKVASVAVAASVLGTYLLPSHAGVVATAAVLAVWALNARGITKTAAGATVIAIVVSVALLALSLRVLTASDRGADSMIAAVPDAGGLTFAVGVAAAFFAFAGYARIVTLGEEVREPETTLVRAIVIALSAVVVVYLVVGWALARTADADSSLTDAPLVLLGDAADVPVAVVTGVAVLSVFGALLAVMAGAGRTAMAMARERDLPRTLAHQGRSGAPWRAEAMIAVAATALVWMPGVTLLLVSVAGLLTYYGVANVAAFRQRRRGRTTGLALPLAVPVVGLIASASLAVVALTSAFEASWTALALLAVAGGWWAAATLARHRGRM